MSDLTMHELYNHQMAVYGETEFDTPKIKRRECDTCHRTLFIREHKDTCISCRKEIRERKILDEIANSKCPIYPNVTSYSEMNNYLGL